MRRKIIPYNSNLKELARKLRNEATFGEILLWNELKSRQMFGYDFHRQKPLLNYIADFYCYELDLVIEVDGSYHNHEEQSTADLIRDAELSAYGLIVLRFTEWEIRYDMVNVLRTIEDYVLSYEERSKQAGFK